MVAGTEKSLLRVIVKINVYKANRAKIKAYGERYKTNSIVKISSRIKSFLRLFSNNNI